MNYNYFDTISAAEFMLAESEFPPKGGEKGSPFFRFIWNRSKNSVALMVDDLPLELNTNEVLSCTNLQKVTIKENQSAEGIISLNFNQPFYCVHTNDEEVSCNGLLFFGTDQAPVLFLDQTEVEILDTLLKVLKDEFKMRDRNQQEMLRLLLKRLIIRCTRLARKQLINNDLNEGEIDLIRQFNVLVEEHYRTHRQVSDYAEMMHRSPKTLTNLFALHSEKSPLQVIHDRIIMEAKRLLLYSGKSIKEIGHELGFSDPSQFSRFFKKRVGKNMQEFREARKLPQVGQN